MGQKIAKQGAAKQNNTKQKTIEQRLYHTSVSYTHLDVYKRQRLYPGPGLQRQQMPGGSVPLYHEMHPGSGGSHGSYGTDVFWM